MEWNIVLQQQLLNIQIKKRLKIVLKKTTEAQTAIFNTKYRKRYYFLLKNILKKWNIITQQWPNLAGNIYIFYILINIYITWWIVIVNSNMINNLILLSFSNLNEILI